MELVSLLRLFLLFGYGFMWASVSDDVGCVIRARLFRTSRHFGKIDFDLGGLLLGDGFPLTFERLLCSHVEFKFGLYTITHIFFYIQCPLSLRHGMSRLEQAFVFFVPSHHL